MGKGLYGFIILFSYRHFLNSNVHGMLPTRLEKDIFESYSELDNLVQMFKKAANANRVYGNGSPGHADSEYHLLKKRVSETKVKLEHHLEMLEKSKGF